MLKNKLIKGLLGVSAAVAMCGAFTAQARSSKAGMSKPPVTGEANDHTSPGAVMQPGGQIQIGDEQRQPGRGAASSG